MIRIKNNTLPLYIDMSYCQLLYVEKDKNNFIDTVFSNIESYPDLFRVNEDRIKSKVFYAEEDEVVGFDLVYIPRLINEWSDNLEQILEYNYPSLDMKQLNLSNVKNVNSISYTQFFSKILDTKEAAQIDNGLLVYNYELGELLFYPLKANNIDTLTGEIRTFFGEIEVLLENIESKGNEGRDFNNYALTLGPPPSSDPDPEEYRLDEEYIWGGNSILLQDIRDKISSLIKSGHEKLLLRLVLEEISKTDSLLEHQSVAKNLMYLLDVFRSEEENLNRVKYFKKHYLPKQQPSPLIIDQNYKIFLPEYNNLEIKLTPLQKAVYFLFLRHPEGILFKRLGYYRQELQDIYCDISNRECLDSIEKSIDDICNPAENSINEKCSRIKEAFLSQFTGEIAGNYYITGDRGYPKVISLDRALVTWKVRLSYDDRDEDIMTPEDLDINNL